jgi:uncharacterized spore protein YtfJ
MEMQSDLPTTIPRFRVNRGCSVGGQEMARENSPEEEGTSGGGAAEGFL